MRTFFVLIVILQIGSGCGPTAAQRYQPTTDTLLLPLGNDTVQVLKSQYGEAPAPFFIHVHHNEQTADSATRQLLQDTGGTFLSLQNDRQRLIKFRLNGAEFTFDPNRMFTPEGATQSLQLLSKPDTAALASVLCFSKALLAQIPDSVPVIAVHNNTNGAYSLLSYLPGGEYAAEAATVFRNAEMDPDDFVLTTDSLLFNALRANNINAILQHNGQALNDGSLGYYFGKMGRSYTNVETEHGHFAEQLRLIEAVLKALDTLQKITPPTVSDQH